MHVGAHVGLVHLRVLSKGTVHERRKHLSEPEYRRWRRTSVSYCTCMQILSACECDLGAAHYCDDIVMIGFVVYIRIHSLSMKMVHHGHTD